MTGSVDTTSGARRALPGADIRPVVGARPAVASGKRGQLRQNVVWGIAATSVNGALMAISYSVYLHYLGYEQYGVWLVLSTVLAFAQLGNLGLTSAVTKLVAEEHGRSDYGAAQEYVSTATAVLVTMGLLTCGVVAVVRDAITSAFALGGANAEQFRALVLPVAALSGYVFVVQALTGCLAGLGRIDLAHLAQLAGRAAAFAVSAVLLEKGYGLYGLFLGNAASYALVHIFAIAFIRRASDGRLHAFKISGPSYERLRKLLRIGGAVFSGSILNLLVMPAQKLFLARYGSLSQVTLYETAYTGAMQIRSLLEAGMRALTPEISRTSQGSSALLAGRLRTLSGSSFRLILVAGIPLYGALAAASPFVLHVWLQHRYLDAQVTPFRIMLFGSYLSLLGVPGYYLLLGLGRARVITVTHVLQTSVALVATALCVGLGARSGLVACVAASASIAFVVATLFLMWSERRVAADLARTSAEDVVPS